MNGNAPYSSRIGSHTDVNRNRNPNLCRGKTEFTQSSYTSSTVISTTVAANRNVISRAISSPSLTFAKNEREPALGPASFIVVLVVATVFGPGYLIFEMAFFSFSITAFGSFA